MKGKTAHHTSGHAQVTNQEEEKTLSIEELRKRYQNAYPKEETDSIKIVDSPETRELINDMTKEELKKMYPNAPILDLKETAGQYNARKLREELNAGDGSPIPPIPPIPHKGMQKGLSLSELMPDHIYRCRLSGLLMLVKISKTRKFDHVQEEPGSPFTERLVEKPVVRGRYYHNGEYMACDIHEGQLIEAETSKEIDSGGRFVNTGMVSVQAYSVK